MQKTARARAVFPRPKRKTRDFGQLDHQGETVSRSPFPGPPTTPHLVVGSSSRSKTSCSVARERSKSKTSWPARSMTSATRSRTWAAVSGFHSLSELPDGRGALPRLPAPVTSEPSNLAGWTPATRPRGGILNPSASGRSNTAQIPRRRCLDRVSWEHPFGVTRLSGVKAMETRVAFRFIVGSLCLIGIASGLLMIEPGAAELRLPNPIGRAALAPPAQHRHSVLSAAQRQADQFPPEHASPCDFSTYKRLSISDWLPAGVLKSVRPVYPAHARAKGISGTVNVRILINRQGHVERVCSIGPEELRVAAEIAAAEWRFRRPTINKGVDPFPYIEEGLVFNFVIDTKAKALRVP